MATKIRLRRRTNSALNTRVVLEAGEPYYNTKSKHLYVGNLDNETVDTKKHIAEITPLNISNSDATIAFQVGEDENNVYTQKISNVDNARKAEQLLNWTEQCTPTRIRFSFGPNNEYGIDQQLSIGMSGTSDTSKNVTESIDGVAISDIFENNGLTVKSATTSIYADDNTNKTIGQRFIDVTNSIEEYSNGDRIAKFAKYTEEDQVNSIHDRIESIKETLEELAESLSITQQEVAKDIAKLNIAVEGIIAGGGSEKS